MKKLLTLPNVLHLWLFCVIANSYVAIVAQPLLLLAIVPAFLFLNVLAGIWEPETDSKRLKFCHHGGVLLFLFAASLIPSVIYHIVLASVTWDGQIKTFIFSALFCICAEAIVFWNGILCVYCTSRQMGVKWRVIGALCGMIPVLNLIVLHKIFRMVMDEVAFETQKQQTDIERQEQRICDTKYPILLVHGVFFRDSRYFNYWGRIPGALQANGARVYYGEHSSARPVAESAQEIAERIREIVTQQGCEKVNIIAHSKGGLDCRYALSQLSMAPYVASLTTINTPHRGCLFADRLLDAAPEKLKQGVANTYNATLRRLGDREPDFLCAVGDLTHAACERLNEQLTPPQGVFCQSVGSKLNRASNGQFPLNVSYQLVKHFDGDNDGLVGAESFSWGEKYTFVTVSGKRGVSHGDMIDLNRENIKDFDVREFYVSLVQDLKEQGL